MSKKDSLFNLDDVISKLPESAGKPDVSVKKVTALSNKYKEITDVEKIPKGTYIRYKTHDGEIKPGGTVYELITLESGEKAYKIHKYNKKLNKNFVWTVKLSEVEKFYKFEDDEKPVQKTEVKTVESDEQDLLSKIGGKIMFGDTDMLKSRIEALEESNKKLQKDLINLFLVVKKLCLKLN